MNHLYLRKNRNKNSENNLFARQFLLKIAYHSIKIRKFRK